MLRAICQRSLYAKNNSVTAMKSFTLRNFTKSAALRQQVKTEPHQKFDPSWLDYLACPISKKPLTYDDKNNELISEAVGVAYPIRDGIPVLLTSEARKLA